MIEYSPLPRVGALKYSGWSLLGIVIVVQPTFALIGLILTQVVFWIWTQPANRATSNWTVQPPDAELLRSQWEYSHAAGALLQMTVIRLLFLAALRRER